MFLGIFLFLLFRYIMIYKRQGIGVSVRVTFTRKDKILLQLVYHSDLFYNTYRLFKFIFNTLLLASPVCMYVCMYVCL